MIGTNRHNGTSVTYSDIRVIGGTTVLRRMIIWSKGEKVYELDLFAHDEANLEIQPEGKEE